MCCCLFIAQLTLRHCVLCILIFGCEAGISASNPIEVDFDVNGSESSTATSTTRSDSFFA